VDISRYIQGLAFWSSHHNRFYEFASMWRQHTHAWVDDLLFSSYGEQNGSISPYQCSAILLLGLSFSHWNSRDVISIYANRLRSAATGNGAAASTEVWCNFDGFLDDIGFLAHMYALHISRKSHVYRDGESFPWTSTVRCVVSIMDSDRCIFARHNYKHSRVRS